MIVARVVGEHPAEDLGVERLDPAAQDLGKSGLLFDQGDGHPGLLEVRGRSAGRDELDPALDEGAGQIGDARLVVDGNEGPPQRRDRRGHGDRFGHGRGF